MTAPDLTPAEARAEVEAFLGEGWACLPESYMDGFLRAYNPRLRIRIAAHAPTYRAAVSALKDAWRDAVRPWVELAFDEGCDYIRNEKHEAQHIRISRVLKEDDK